MMSALFLYVTMLEPFLGEGLVMPTSNLMVLHYCWASLLVWIMGLWFITQRDVYYLGFITQKMKSWLLQTFHIHSLCIYVSFSVSLFSSVLQNIPLKIFKNWNVLNILGHVSSYAKREEWSKYTLHKSYDSKSSYWSVCTHKANHILSECPQKSFGGELQKLVNFSNSHCVTLF